MKNTIKTTKGKKALSMLLALVMVLSVAGPAMSPIMGIVAKATQKVADNETAELALDNLFIFEQWANSVMSGKLPGGFEDYGSLVKDIPNGSLTLTKTNANQQVFYTGFDFNTCSFYYTIPVEANTKYNFSFNVTGGDYASYVFYYDKERTSLGTIPGVSFESSASNNWTFTTHSKAAYIQVRFDSNSTTATTFSNIRICKADTYTGTPVRDTFIAGTGAYTLPTPTREGYVFGGWYTGENGTGERITNDTPVENLSFSVFARWDEKVNENGLSIKTNPEKTEYSKGEHIDTTGLVLNAVVGSETKEVTSGFTCSPEVLDTVGTQPVTVTYGGETATFNVVVKESLQTNILFNDKSTQATITNGTYTFNKTTDTPFNRYELTYKTSSYMKGTITFDDDKTEEFFLEPSDNGNFVSYIDNFFIDATEPSRSGIKSIKFEYLDKNLGDFELLSVSAKPESRLTDDNGNLFLNNDEFEVGINLTWGGTLAYLEDLKNKPKAEASTEGTVIDEGTGNGKDGTYGNGLNLINTYDRGRYVQPAYYGTEDAEEYISGTYKNDNNWPYNPVQGGNDKDVDGVGSSKVVDYAITKDVNGNVTEIYVKTQALDWAKSKEHITPSYMETRYVFDHGMVKANCRFIDFSGYKYAEEKRQEIPAVYPIEPFNQFVYYGGGEAWSTGNAKKTEDKANIYFNESSDPVDRTCNENWAAFIDSEENYGLGIYSSRADGFSVGVFGIGNDASASKAITANPTEENPTSYVTPYTTFVMESYKAEEYSYYLTTGSPEEIRNDFGLLVSQDYAERVSRAKIAVPETIYMTPSTGASTTGQYFVNNSIDGNGLLTTEAKSNATEGIISVYSPGSTAIKFSVNRISGSNIGDPVIGNGTVEGTYEDQRWEHSAIYGAYETGSSKDWFLFNKLGLAIDGTGLSATGTATLEWIVTVYYGDDDTVGETHYAYTTIYAPFYAPVGAASEVSTNTANFTTRAWAGSILWVDGVHGYSALSGVTTNSDYYKGAKFPNLSSTYNLVPMLNAYTETDDNKQPSNWFSDNASSSTISYNTITYTNGNTESNNNAAVFSVSPKANLTVDTSRYINFNQIPNFKVGFMITDTENSKNGTWFVADYTGYTSDIMCDRSGGTSASTYEEYYNRAKGDNLASGSDKNYGEKFRGLWDKSISSSGTYQLKASFYNTPGTRKAWNHNFIQIDVTTVNKSTLRDLVLEGSGLNQSDYTAASWENYRKELAEAAAELGNPTDSDVATATTELTNARNALQTNVTFDNLFDFTKYNINGNLTVDERTITGFTVTSKAEDGNTGIGEYIPVEPGKTYIVSADVAFEAVAGGGYDIYLHTVDSNKSGETTAVPDTSNGAHRESTYYISLTTQIDNTKPYIRFTAGDNTRYIGLRIDANNTGNKLTVNNIRVEETSSSVSPANKYATYNSTIGELPVPTKTGYTFVGWYDKNGNEVTKETIVKGPMQLFSKWEEKTYPIFYSANGPALSELKGGTVKYESNTFALPDPTNWKADWSDYGEFIGWSVDPYADPHTDIDIINSGSEYSAKTLPDGALNDQEQIVFHAIWKLKDKCFVEDKTVVDFGLSTKYDPFGNDQSVAGYHRNFATVACGVNTTGDLDTYSDSVNGLYGKFSVEGDKVLYTPSKIMMGIETAYFVGSYTYKDGGVTQFKTPITVVPASNMYYEENVIDTVANPQTYQWTKKGSSTIGTQEFGSDNDVYGSDSAYENSTGFSNGTYYRADVTSDNKKSDTATFEFVGSGFDLISACGTNTGVQIVKISKLQSDGNYKALKSIIVDTYFTDTSIMNGDLLHQVPVVNYRGDYDTYKVETTATYLNSAGAVKSGTATIAYSSAFGDGTSVETGSGEPSKALLNELEELGFEDLGDDIEVTWMDENSAFNGGSGSPNASIFSGSAKMYYAYGETTTVTGLRNYIDGIRIYNPLNGGNGYYKDSEQNATYYNIVEELELDTDHSNMAYIESSDAGFSLNFETDFNFDAYNQQGGPKGEIYLKKGDAIAFKFTAETNGKDAYAMLGMRAVCGTANASVYTDASKETPYTQAISSATEMYYNVSSAVTVENGEVTIVVANTGDGILAVNNLKLVNGKLTASGNNDSAENPILSGNNAMTDIVGPVTPENEGTIGSETDVDTETNVPETDAKTEVEEETGNNISVAIPGLPAPIASFLEMLFKLLSQLVGSLGF